MSEQPQKKPSAREMAKVQFRMWAQQMEATAQFLTEKAEAGDIPATEAMKIALKCTQLAGRFTEQLVNWEEQEGGPGKRDRTQEIIDALHKAREKEEF